MPFAICKQPDYYVIEQSAKQSDKSKTYSLRSKKKYELAHLQCSASTESFLFLRTL